MEYYGILLEYYGIYSAIKRNETVPFAETWMDLETVIQSHKEIKLVTPYVAL